MVFHCIFLGKKAIIITSMGDMVGNNLIRKSNYLRLEKTPVQKVPKIELIVMLIINYYAD